MLSLKHFHSQRGQHRSKRSKRGGTEAAERTKEVIIQGLSQE